MLPIRAVTESAFQTAKEANQEALAKQEQALADPQSREDFQTFLRHQGEDALSLEQLARYDAIEADITRELRAAKIPDTVTQFESEELSSCEFTIKEGYHLKRDCKLWILQLSSRTSCSDTPCGM